MNNTSLVASLQPSFQDKDPGTIIRLAREHFGERMMMTTAFGYSGIVLLSFVRKIFPEIPCYFIDTGYHFEETLKLHHKLKDEWGLNMITLRTKHTEHELMRIQGHEGYKTDPDQCCYLRKIEPLMEIMDDNSVWLSATRKDQSFTRAHTEAINVDGRDQIKINPLYSWTADQCWNHIRKFALPYNPLHDQYYPSVGCYPCTRPVDKGGEERSGRWVNSEKTECGLHLPNSNGGNLDKN